MGWDKLWSKNGDNRQMGGRGICQNLPDGEDPLGGEKILECDDKIE